MSTEKIKYFNLNRVSRVFRSLSFYANDAIKALVELRCAYNYKTSNELEKVEINMYLLEP